MPLHDFESELARQLKNRELQPSEESWEKLQGRLEKEDTKGSPVIWWMGIAASVVGVFIFFNFLAADPVVDTAPAVVESDPGREIEVPKKQSTSVSKPAEEGVVGAFAKQ